MKVKIENGKLVITPESAGEKIALYVWQESDESIILEGYDAQQSVQPTVLTAQHKLVKCPQCLLVFDANSPASHIG